MSAVPELNGPTKRRQATRPVVTRLLVSFLLIAGTLWLAACDTGGAVAPSVVKVEIDQSNQAIAVGGSVTLTAKVTVLGGATKTIGWSSSDSAIATVSSGGVVTGVAVGTATITVTTLGKPTRTDSITVMVAAEAGVVSVEIEQDDQSIEVGATLPLTAEVMVVGGGTEDVVWSSSDSAIATVSSAGLVTGVAVGTATITATSVGTPIMTDSINIEVIPVGAGDQTRILSFAGSVTTGSQALLTWTTENTATVTLYAVTPAGTDEQEIGTYTGASVGATVPLPDAGHQAYRLDATGASGTVSSSLAALPNVVVNDDDYDVYDLRGWEPQPSIAGSLRSVLFTAPAGSVIGFASDVTQITVYGVDILHTAGATDGHLILRNDVTISGPVATPVELVGVSAHDFVTGPAPGDPVTYGSRMVYVPTGVTATLENLVISGGSFIYYGAGIQNAGTLTVRNCTITGNRAFGTGGGIRNVTGATLTVEDSIITDNQAITLDSEIDHDWLIRGAPGEPAQFPGVNGWGGGLANEGTATVTNTVISDNTARQSGGGVYNIGTLTLNDTTVSGNTADHLTGYTEVGLGDYSEGGGIANFATLTFTGGSVTSNLAADQGGGLFQYANGMGTVTNVSVTTNVAGVPGNLGYGGGIMHHYFTGEIDTNLILTGVTHTGNTPQDILHSDDGVRSLSLGLVPGAVDRSALPQGVTLDERK